MFYLNNNVERIGAILLAAGSGTRMGGDNKMLRSILGKSVLRRSLETILMNRQIECCVIMVSEATYLEATRCIEALKASQKCTIVYGGSSRAESVFLGLQDANVKEMDFIAVHDGARCLLDDHVLSRCIEEAKQYGSAVASVAATDTMVYVDDDGNMTKPLIRKMTRHMQTPQVFCAEHLQQAYEHARNNGFGATDDARLIYDMGWQVHLVEGSNENIKITMESDLKLAESILEKREGKQCMKVGFGEDVHALISNGGPLILAGVSIPHEKGLMGHSDADVVAHAVTDALLGAMAWGDIGQWFPDTDERYRGADSMLLLQYVVKALQEYNQEILHVDITIVAQRPKISSYCKMMREQLAQVLEISIDQVSLKATTSERLGFEGEEKGITVRSVATVKGCVVSFERINQTKGDK